MRKFMVVMTVMSGLCAAARAQVKTLKPGWNLFSPQQDVQLGREASAEIEKKLRVVHNRELDQYLNTLLNRLKQSPHAGDFPYTIHAIADKNVNAFSLPGGPLYVNTGLILACDNEAQLAGVIGHEMSHIALRHATNQVSKQNLISIPALLAGAVVGHSLLGQLAQLGIGAGAHSVLLKFSRTDEAQADYNGAEIAAEAGYNPLEMANFFEKLEKQSGRRGVMAELLSDHPNPGNRVAAVQEEIRQMPQRSFTADTGQFPRIKDLVSHLPAPGRLVGTYDDGHVPGAPAVRPSGRYAEYRGKAFSLAYPDNWQVFGDQQGNMVTIAPPDAVIQSGTGSVAIGYGIEVSYYFPPGDTLDLSRDTRSLIAELQRQNSGMRTERESQPVQAGGQRGLLTVLTSRSPFQGETELDYLLTVPRPEGLFYLVVIGPRSEAAQIEDTFQRVLVSLRFTEA